MATSVKTFFVTGATGQQGGGVARHLLEQGQRVRVLTRSAAKAEALNTLGAEIVVGDLTDRSVLEKALVGVDGVFGMTTPFEGGMEAEVQQGKTLADAAKAANVKHYVFTSVGGADKNSGIPHFETKWKVEQHIGQIGLPATILRPTFFMDNFGSFFREGILKGTLTLPMRPETKLQMIAVNNIGQFGGEALLRPDEFMGKAIELAGDDLTMPEVIAHLSRTMNRTIRFQQLPDDQAEAAMGYDMATMFRWFNEVGYSADISALQQRYGIPLTTFGDLLAGVEWAKG